MESLEKKLDKVSRSAKTGNKEAQKEAAVLSTLKSGLEAGTSVRAISVGEDDFRDYVKPLQLITAKPVLYVCNVDEAAAVSGNDYVEKVITMVADEFAEVLYLAHS